MAKFLIFGDFVVATDKICYFDYVKCEGINIDWEVTFYCMGDVPPRTAYLSQAQMDTLAKTFDFNVDEMRGKK